MTTNVLLSLLVVVVSVLGTLIIKFLGDIREDNKEFRKSLTDHGLKIQRLEDGQDNQEEKMKNLTEVFHKTMKTCEIRPNS